ncbi:MAG: hypothetical protein EOP06_25085 [Proteobacteria bacterium]|nr:MAG: hypothetical protein EOP06_25085 [Pseudomonadota bacterium]
MKKNRTAMRAMQYGKNKANTATAALASTHAKGSTGVEQNHNTLDSIEINCSSYQQNGSDYMPGALAATKPSLSVEMAWISAMLSKSDTDLPTFWGDYGIIKSWGVDRNYTAIWSIYAADYEWFCVFIPRGVEWGEELIKSEIGDCAPYLVPNPDAPFPLLRKNDAGEEATRVATSIEDHRLVTVTRPQQQAKHSQGDLLAWMRFAPQVCLEIATFMAQESLATKTER